MKQQHPLPKLCALHLVTMRGMECHQDEPNTVINATVYNALSNNLPVSSLDSEGIVI